MGEFLNIKQAIYDYFETIEGKIYEKDIAITKRRDTYNITLEQGNWHRPIQLFIEAESEQDCIDQLIAELRLKHLTFVKYCKLFKFK